MLVIRALSSTLKPTKNYEVATFYKQANTRESPAYLKIINECSVFRNSLEFLHTSYTVYVKILSLVSKTRKFLKPTITQLRLILLFQIRNISVSSKIKTGGPVLQRKNLIL